MRRFYVVPKDVWAGHHPWSEGVTRPRYNLFCPQTGSHYIDLPDGLILLSGTFANSENERIWHSHFHVARLPHPETEANVPMCHLQHPDHEHKWFHKQYREHHHKALVDGLGVQDHHTVWDLHRIAKAIHPLVRLDERY